MKVDSNFVLVEGVIIVVKKIKFIVIIVFKFVKKKELEVVVLKGKDEGQEFSNEKLLVVIGGKFFFFVKKFKLFVKVKFVSVLGIFSKLLIEENKLDIIVVFKVRLRLIVIVFKMNDVVKFDEEFFKSKEES